MNPSPNLVVAFAWASVLLALNLLFVWMWSGVVRARTGRTVNPEDGARWGKPVDEHDPPAVARVMRAYSNALASIVPFALLAVSFVALNGNVLFAEAVFAVFVVCRWLHTLAYLRSWQPARSILYALAFFATLALGAGVIARAVEVTAVT
jgi:microsomal prostaglandin-E synthase 1